MLTRKRRRDVLRKNRKKKNVFQNERTSHDRSSARGAERAASFDGMAWRAFVRLPRRGVSTQARPAVPFLDSTDPLRWLVVGGGFVGLGVLFAPEMASPTQTQGSAVRPVAVARFTEGNPQIAIANIFETTDKGGWSLLSPEYRRNVFFVYEKRLREHAPPEKVFEYFSSVKADGGTFMTSLDLMRAAVPVFQPTNSVNIRSGSLGGENSDTENSGTSAHAAAVSNFFTLFDTDGDGLISFPEYVFFITLLSLGVDEIVKTFTKFDVDNSGCLSRTEFLDMMRQMRLSTSRAGKASGYRTGLKTTNVDDIANAGLVQHLFGDAGGSKKTRKKKPDRLTLKKFKHFLGELRTEMHSLEFTHYDYTNVGSISSTDFAHSIVAGAKVGRLQHFIDRSSLVSKMEHDRSTKTFSPRITKHEYMAFCKLLKHDNAGNFTEKIKKCAAKGGRLDKARFLQIAKECGAALSETQVEVIFFIFDVDNDGELSPNEFLDVACRYFE
jgi:Ca2+-binding EF-hand superfamily protein